MTHQLLKGKKGLIFGALDEKSLAWQVAVQAYQEGASLVLTNAPVALRLGKIQALSEKVHAPVIPADATVVEDLEKLITQSMQHLDGKLDFVLHSIGMSLNVRKNRPYTDLNYDFMMKTLDISAISFHKVLQTCYKLDAINEWGSVVALTFIASQRVFPEYNDMADAKAMLESIARNFGYFYAEKKVRINTVSQSPTMTTAGTGVKGFNDFYEYSDKTAPLGNASAEDCARFVVVLFSDYTRMITMQNIYHDGGYSSVGVNSRVLRGAQTE
ncbi:MAG: enoyl-[acyl-carrier-protein] reductase [NADH] [Chitinophagales bacterium]|nr:MAG: enoyl-[acyl-carrier-protein] reductase [NADH] [Chitinophagales bacterium]